MPSLYLTQPGTRLELEHGRLVASQGTDEVLSVPATRIDRVIVVGGCHVTTPALAFLLDHHIDLVFLAADGRVRGRLDAGTIGSLATRRLQYRRADDAAFALALAKAIVAGKARNARTRCLELDTDNDPAALTLIARITAAIEGIPAAPDLDVLRGLEGSVARWYFAVLGRHLREPWTFTKRARRPPPDPVNAILSIVYTLLMEQCRAALTVTGLDPECGFLHAERPGRPSLALDLMEEFRPVIADPVAWTLFNNRMLAERHFVAAERGRGVRLTPEGWKQVARQYTRRLERPIHIPGRVTKITYRKVLEVQAWRLRRVIDGDVSCYEPFLTR